MKSLSFLKPDKTKEPSTLTPETAEPILDIVSKALQQDDGLPYYPRSSLKGHDVIQIDAALMLRIANDFLRLAAMDREAELDDRAKQWQSIPFLVATKFVDDAERNTLRTLPRDSPEYLRLDIELISATIDASGAMPPQTRIARNALIIR